jgi:hypothetical protein
LHHCGGNAAFAAFDRHRHFTEIVGILQRRSELHDVVVAADVVVRAALVFDAVAPGDGDDATIRSSPAGPVDRAIVGIASGNPAPG